MPGSGKLSQRNKCGRTEEDTFTIIHHSHPPHPPNILDVHQSTVVCKKWKIKFLLTHHLSHIYFTSLDNSEGTFHHMGIRQLQALNSFQLLNQKTELQLDMPFRSVEF